ncbi:MAG: Nramp family divalent metal transporter [candidate division Zixibacteria bacterium]|nr:Nramp family divalent metal transporter [candidate division Zixibacteria bacterium]
MRHEVREAPEDRPESAQDRREVPAGELPPWTVAELPAPRRLTVGNALAVMGPGIIMLSASIGSGEWVFGPALAVQYGFAILWIVTLAIITQTVLNGEFMRYTLYTGEPILVGFMRLKPGPAFWGCFYFIIIMVSYGWPGWAGGCAAVVFAIFTGHLPDPTVPGDPETQKLIAAGVFLVCIALLAFSSQVIERGLEKLNWVIVGWILIFLFFACLFFAPFGLWGDVLGGFFSFGSLPPAGMDYLLLGAVAGYAAGGGIANCAVSHWARDKGYGMGGVTGYIPSMIGGKEIRLPNVGKVFETTPENVSKFRLWWRYVVADQYILYGPGAFLGMFFCILLAVAVIPAATQMTGLGVGAYQAEYLGKVGGNALRLVALITGFFILFGTQLGIVDFCVRMSTDIAWAGSERLRRWSGDNPRKIYYTMLAIFVVWGMIALNLQQPFVLLQLQANMAAFVFIIISVHVLILNQKLLPKVLRPKWWQKLAVGLNALIYLVFTSMAVGRWIGVW